MRRGGYYTSRRPEPTDVALVLDKDARAALRAEAQALGVAPEQIRLSYRRPRSDGSLSVFLGRRRIGSAGWRNLASNHGRPSKDHPLRRDLSEREREYAAPIKIVLAWAAGRLRDRFKSLDEALERSREALASIQKAAAGKKSGAVRSTPDASRPRRAKTAQAVAAAVEGLRRGIRPESLAAMIQGHQSVSAATARRAKRLALKSASATPRATSMKRARPLRRK